MKLKFGDLLLKQTEMHGHHTKSNFCINDRIIIINHFVPPTTNYGLKQLKVNSPMIRNELPTYLKMQHPLTCF